MFKEKFNFTIKNKKQVYRIYTTIDHCEISRVVYELTDEFEFVVGLYEKKEIMEDNNKEIWKKTVEFLKKIGRI